MTTELKPCPFCGGPTDPVVEYEPGKLYVRHAGQPHCPVPRIALTAEQWNHRASQPSPIDLRTYKDFPDDLVQPIVTTDGLVEKLRALADWDEPQDRVLPLHELTFGDLDKAADRIASLERALTEAVAYIRELASCDTMILAETLEAKAAELSAALSTTNRLDDE